MLQLEDEIGFIEFVDTIDICKDILEKTMQYIKAHVGPLYSERLC